MSDDLISRKAFMEYLGLEDTEENREENVGEIVTLEDFDRQATAFDKEKVIEDLNDWMKDAEKWATKYDEIGDIDNMDLQDMAARCYKVAIEIVEKGGLN